MLHYSNILVLTTAAYISRDVTTGITLS